MAFRKHNRLQKSSIIQLICKKGASWKTPFFHIKFLPSQLGKSKIAIITSKKIDKRAVYRNKIRRRISSCFENLITNNTSSHNTPILMVIFPSQKVLSVPYSDIVKTSKFSLKKIQEKIQKKKINNNQK